MSDELQKVYNRLSAEKADCIKNRDFVTDPLSTEYALLTGRILGLTEALIALQEYGAYTQEG